MKLKKMISLLAMLSFLVTVLTSVILFIVPQGRVAYWANWTLFGLSKEEWGAIHINVGFLFLFTLIFHIYFNWKPILSYLKNKGRKVIFFTKEFNIALLITAGVVFGTYWNIPPLSSIIELGDHIKDNAAETYGEPPYGHAELSSLKTFSKKMGMDLKKVMFQLKQKGIQINSEQQTLKVIAVNNELSPQQLYELIQPVEKKEKVSLKMKALPDMPVPGTGKLTLIDFCHQYNLNIKFILRELKALDLQVDEEDTLQRIGEVNKRGTLDIYASIRVIVTEKGK